jgi:hypothetical protein
MRIARQHPSARRAQLLELEIVTDRIAGEFARILGRRAAGGATPPVMASVTMAVLTQAFRTWYEQPSTRIGAIVDDIFEALGDLVGSGSPAPQRRGGRVAPATTNRRERERHAARG